MEPFTVQERDNPDHNQHNANSRTGPDPRGDPLPASSGSVRLRP
jgi:hypothetical protein